MRAGTCRLPGTAVGALSPGAAAPRACLFTSWRAARVYASSCRSAERHLPVGCTAFCRFRRRATTRLAWPLRDVPPAPLASLPAGAAVPVSRQAILPSRGVQDIVRLLHDLPLLPLPVPACLYLPFPILLPTAGLRLSYFYLTYRTSRNARLPFSLLRCALAGMSAASGYVPCGAFAFV